MKEQEIIEYLKENKTKGVAFGFMPEEVKDWCEIHPSNIFRFFTQYDGKENKNGMWKTISNENYEIVSDDILCLPNEYELPQKPKGEWVEFEIDQKGRFRCFIKDFMFYFFWANWNTFLAEAYSSGYTAFGGWQYKDCEIWYMTPQVFLDDHYVNVVFKGEDRVKPAIPVKIRFWRENK